MGSFIKSFPYSSSVQIEMNEYSVTFYMLKPILILIHYYLIYFFA